MGLAATYWPVTVLAGFGICAASIGGVGIWVLNAMASSVGVDKPTPTQLEEEEQKRHALFRHVPALIDRLAWRELGTYPTPIHRATCMAKPIAATSPTTAAEKVSFYVKREDLSSSDAYAGNKIRTLQHQLAVIESKLERGCRQRGILVVGSGGSNQVVATVVHAMRLKLASTVTALWWEDPPDLDNTLNMLTTLSFTKICVSWGHPLFQIIKTLSRCLSGCFVVPLGGNNAVGVLGQVSGALELAEQIQSAEAPDCDGIYVSVGSSCTVSGLIIGVALARKLKLKAFAKDGFKIHLVPIHHGIAMLSRCLDLYKSKMSRYLPSTARHSIHAACALLTQLGGPDVLAEALAVLEYESIVHHDANLVGMYGAHSAPSLACARLFDETSSVTCSAKREQAGLWVCGHFSAKALAAMCEDLLDSKNAGKNMLFWSTKSLVQPRGKLDEWHQLQQMPQAVRQWAQQGMSQSQRRPGKVDVDKGSPDDYRSLMTYIQCA